MKPQCFSSPLGHIKAIQIDLPLCRLFDFFFFNIEPSIITIIGPQSGILDVVLALKKQNRLDISSVHPAFSFHISALKWTSASSKIAKTTKGEEKRREEKKREEEYQNVCL